MAVHFLALYFIYESHLEKNFISHMPPPPLFPNGSRSLSPLRYTLHATIAFQRHPRLPRLNIIAMNITFIGIRIIPIFPFRFPHCLSIHKFVTKRVKFASSQTSFPTSHFLSPPFKIIYFIKRDIINNIY